MKAGRELDTLIAEKVMGYELCTETFYNQLDTAETYYFISGGDVEVVEYTRERWLKYIFSPSTNIAAAWQVVERLRNTHVYQCDDFGRNMHKKVPHYACFHPIDRGSLSRDEGVRAKTPELAICLAALKAVGWEGEAVE
ncbi:BC1872 family protein [Aneurinibacillus terranovensis]|uniref:BC1872 family protein n=1 Tax=Aneurinibacillus terranovensis TaxID=278991 RepID=UPI00042961B9|nr:hypothetical protein [Aneurinibacillus terranovensis]